VGFCGQADESLDFIEIAIFWQAEYLRTAKGSPYTRELVMQYAMSL
jgi:hypothetical protein